MKPKTYYLMKPLCHGNGGWSGDSLLASGPLDKLLKRTVNPDNYHPYAYDPYPRICDKPDVNSPVYRWDDTEETWQKVKREKKAVKKKPATPKLKVRTKKSY